MDLVLRSLHGHEENIRLETLAAIDQNPNLQTHLTMISDSLRAVIALTYDHRHLSEDELTVQLLGLRLLNSSAATVKLALSGYYQAAVALVRDVFETSHLLDYLQTSPKQIATWRTSDKKQRKDQFGPAPIRRALDIRDGFTGNKRYESYERLCEFAVHPTFQGFKLVAPEGLGMIGPFFNLKYLKAWLEETVKLVIHGTLVLLCHFPRVEPDVQLALDDLTRSANVWRNRYFGADTA